MGPREGMESRASAVIGRLRQAISWSGIGIGADSAQAAAGGRFACRRLARLGRAAQSAFLVGFEEHNQAAAAGP